MFSVICTIMEDKKFKSQMKQLKQAFKDNEKFVLFIGAGQNGGANMHLMWSDLIGDVSRTSFRQLFQELGVDIKDSHAIMEAIGIYSNRKSANQSTEKDKIKEPGRDCQDKKDKILEDSTNEYKDNQNDQEQVINKKLLNYINSNLPIEIQVSMVKSLMKDHYIPALQQKLYSECNYNEILKSFKYRYRYGTKPSFIHYAEDNKDFKELYTLFTIARMILLNPQIESAITFNFDNFIRQAVRVLLNNLKIFFSLEEINFLHNRFWYVSDTEKPLAEKVFVRDIHDNNVSRSKNVGLNCFPVYHVHGYIPDPNEEEIVEMPHIVMALEEFIEQQTDGLSWQDSVQIDAFRNANIIFIGCSMTDLTMKRMINFAHTNGYTNNIYILNANGRKEPVTDMEKIAERQIEVLEKVRQRYFEELGATYITCPNGYNSLCDALAEITYPNLHS